MNTKLIILDVDFIQLPTKVHCHKRKKVPHCTHQNTKEGFKNENIVVKINGTREYSKKAKLISDREHILHMEETAYKRIPKG